jgi:hypothetical protein
MVKISLSSVFTIAFSLSLSYNCSKEGKQMAQESDKARKDTPDSSGSRARKHSEASKTTYLGFRIPEEEMKSLEAAARATGETVSEYVRNAIAARMEGQKQVIPSSSVTYAIPTMTVIDSKSSQFQTRVHGITTHAKNIQLAEDDPLRKGA